MKQERKGVAVSRKLLGGVAGAACFAAVMCASSAASAQEENGPNSVTAPGKGIVGGALLGGEVVTIPMGAAGLKPWWPYLVFGTLGSAGGAVGGWAVEQAVPDVPVEVPLYLLAGGLALVIPTVVLAANATTKSEFEDESDPSTLEKQPADQQAPAPGTIPGETPPAGTEPQPGSPSTPGSTPPASSPPETSSRKVRRARTARARPAMSLLDMWGTELRMGVPAVTVKNMYSEEEIAKYGVEQKTEVHLPVFRAAF